MLVMIGHDNMVQREAVVAVLQVESAHARKLKKSLEEKGMLVNATSGHKARSLLVLSSGQAVLCALTPEVIQKRINGSKE